MSGADVPECGVADLHAAWSDGAYVLDVREPSEYAEGHVPSAVLIPLGELPSRVGEVPRDRPVYVICRSGRRSLTGARALAVVGIAATSVRGGTMAWMQAGYPVSTEVAGRR